MITRIELTNFMSHQHTVIEPAAGLTVLVGPNNCGKSALVAALQILCTNDNSTYVMRHGQKECSVSVETDDGHVITWRRKESPSYLIDGTEFSRLRQSGLPEKLHQVLRLPKVDAGSDIDFDVHFGTQKDPIFLLRSPAAHAAKFFASSSDAIHLVEMQKRHKDRLEESKREKNRLEVESKQLTAELECLEPSLDLDRRCKEVELLFTEIESIANRAESAQSLAEQWEQRSYAAWLHRQVLELLASLAAPPTLEDADTLAKLVDKLTETERSYQAAGTQVQSLQNLTSPPPQHDLPATEHLIFRLTQTQEAQRRSSNQLSRLATLQPTPDLAETESLFATIKQLEAVGRESALADARRHVVVTLTSPPDLADVASLEKCLRRLSTATTKSFAEKHVVACLSAIVSPPEPTDTGRLEAFLARLEQAQDYVANRYIALQAVRAELHVAETALRRFSEENVCPTCGNRLDAERVLESLVTGGGHLHD